MDILIALSSVFDPKGFSNSRTSQSKNVLDLYVTGYVVNRYVYTQLVPLNAEV